MQVKDEYQTFLLILVVCFITILLVLTIRYLRKRVLTPITILVNETKRISKGNLAQPIHYDRNDEVGQLISAFDNMRNELYVQQLEHQQFEIERKQFIDSISHDLKTPISSISAYIEALQDGIAQTKSEEKEYFRVIQSKIDLLNEVSQQLSLSYQSTDSVPIHLEKVNCQEWSQSFIQDVAMDCQTKGIEIETTCDNFSTNHIYMNIDSHQLERALQNMLDNAYRYTKKVLALSITSRDRFLFITIRNDGAEINESSLEQIFHRFYTNNHFNAEGHLGLGLFIAKTLITAMKGQLEVSLEKDIITFTVSIPLIQHSPQIKCGI
ncbi:HAMP domain-containing sensor histidine kinase [Gracilibacillus alcaliphilus]|uniref:HAMP domain-containing sensor histidine kinase n=1 Tax=Gracilibacillus alcaliphilus TaxID=1401441 RepID=UPI00195A478F|nr:HAMP domain-containing sensor histidine kinase [Gracilibacillus alcaliphilus]MBM7675331.1 signal transduction histidine kinase [Gracilibacillus alcaliphilus]